MQTASSRFEHESPCPFPTMISTAPQAPAYLSIYLCVYVCVCV